jgi:hypothetical protein
MDSAISGCFLEPSIYYYYFFLITRGVRVSLRVPRLFPGSTEHLASPIETGRTPRGWQTCTWRVELGTGARQASPVDHWSRPSSANQAFMIVNVLAHVTGGLKYSPLLVFQARIQLSIYFNFPFQFSSIHKSSKSKEAHLFGQRATTRRLLEVIKLLFRQRKYSINLSK